MPRITMKFDVLELDRNNFTKRLKQYTETHLKRGAKEFARVAIARIPVRTGFVAGAMGALAEVAGFSYQIRPQGFFKRSSFRLGSRANVKRFDRRRDFRKVEYYYPAGGGRVTKTPLSGRKFATQKRNIISFSKRVA